MLLKIAALSFGLALAVIPDQNDELDNGDSFDHKFNDSTILCLSNGTCYAKEEFLNLCTQTNIKEDKNEYQEFYLKYILAKLKVAQAIDLKLDQTDAFRKELVEFSTQLKTSYGNRTDEEIEKDKSYLRIVKQYFEGMLIFEISNQKVWRRSRTDHAEVKEYFEKHPEKYKRAQFEDIKETVAKDYARELEANWIQELKSTYAYRTNKEVYEAVFTEL